MKRRAPETMTSPGPPAQRLVPQGQRIAVERRLDEIIARMVQQTLQYENENENEQETYEPEEYEPTDYDEEEEEYEVGEPVEREPTEHGPDSLFRQRAHDIATDYDEKEGGIAARITTTGATLIDTSVFTMDALDQLVASVKGGASISSIVNTIDREVLPLLQQLTADRERVQSLERSASRVYGPKPCGEVDNFKRDYAPITIDPQQVYDAFIGSEPFAMNVRFVDTDVDPRAFTERFGHDALVQRISEKVASVVPTLNPHMLERERTIAALRQRCETRPTQLAQEAHSAAVTAITNALARASEIARYLVAAFSQLDLVASTPAGRAAVALITAINEAFGTDVGIEVSQPDTSNDAFVAQLLEQCENPHKANVYEMRQLAVLAGLDPQHVMGMDAFGICRAVAQRQY